MRAARSNRVTRVAPMINSHAPLLGLAVRPPCSCLRWPFVGVTALHAERPGTPSDVSARNESCTPVWWVGRDHSSSSVSLRPRMAVSFGFEVVPYGLSGEWRHGRQRRTTAPIAVYHVRVQNRAGVKHDSDMRPAPRRHPVPQRSSWGRTIAATSDRRTWL